MKKPNLLLLLPMILLIAATIDFNDLPNYANQTVPNYITKDNTPNNNSITDEGATLGRVLFYDKNLSANNTIACASCHQQEFAFGDTETQSIGLNQGLTGRHSMRLVNSRFADEEGFFWDERAATLEAQTTQPIQDHVEMGFSGSDGDPDLDSLIRKLEDIDYYQSLFTLVFGDAQITEARMQSALAQFVRSIQSFDSKFDEGLAQVNNINQDFPNFSAEENDGKELYLAPPPAGGAGCQGCHRAPEFDIDPNSGNNGVVGVAGDPSSIDITNTRAPSLRDLVDPNGNLNGPLMHNGEFTSLEQVIDHYDQITVVNGNTNLDNRLAGGGGGGGGPQNLQLTQAEKDALVAFLHTLTGSDIYTNEKWSEPFDDAGNLTLLNDPLEIEEVSTVSEVSMFPNPTNGPLTIQLSGGNYQIELYSINGSHVSTIQTLQTTNVDLSDLQSGVYLVRVLDNNTGEASTKRILKN